MGVPQRLQRFVADEWQPGNATEAFQLWTQARRAWLAEGNAWPGGEAVLHYQELAVASALPDEEGTR